jgi:hypothetical protein
MWKRIQEGDFWQRAAEKTASYEFLKEKSHDAQAL